MDQLPRLGKRELICLLLFTCNYVVFVWRGFLFLWVLGMGYVILLWHSLSLPYNYFTSDVVIIRGKSLQSIWPHTHLFCMMENCVSFGMGHIIILKKAVHIVLADTPIQARSTALW